jgi:hypothetical protein
MINVYKIMVGKPEGKRPLRRPKCRCEDNIKMALRNEGRRQWTRFIWLKIGTRGRLL